jgi:hypothetical protein
MVSSIESILTGRGFGVFTVFNDKFAMPAPDAFPGAQPHAALI